MSLKKHLPSCNKQNVLKIGLVTIRMFLLKNPTKQKPSYLVEEQSSFQNAVFEKNQTKDGQCKKYKFYVYGNMKAFTRCLCMTTLPGFRS